MLSEKYRPKTQDEWFGPRDGLTQIIRGVCHIVDGTAKRKVIIVTGPRGVGKTTAAYLAAKRFDLHVVEVNASDERKTQDVLRICRTAMTRTIFNSSNLLLIDEADGLSKIMQKKLLPILSTTITPIIMCANDSSKIIREIKSKSVKIKLELPTQTTLTHLIEYVSNSEGVSLDQHIIEEVAELATDFRTALSLLTLVFLDGTTEGLQKDEITKSLEEQLNDVFEGNPPDRFTIDPSTVLHYMSENAMDASLIADADVMLRHTKDVDSYKFWRYAYGILAQCRKPRHHKITFPFRTFRRY